MAGQNINQYVYPNLNPKLSLESYDMSLTSDEKGFNMEVVFSPYLIAQTFGNKLPFYFDINSSGSNQKFTLNYKEYNINNIFYFDFDLTFILTINEKYEDYAEYTFYNIQK